MPVSCTLLRIPLYGGYFVVQEFGSAVPRMGNQRLFFREIELEFFKQKCSETLFDDFCLILWSDEREGEVVRIACISESSVVGVLWITRGKFLCLLFDLLGSLHLPLSS